jgi:FkbM family methyltransferase
MSLEESVRSFGAKLLNNFNYSRSISSNIKIPIIAGIGRANLRSPDKHVAHAISYLLSANQHRGTFVDVGTNIGQTLIKVASIGGIDLSYIGFEPNPSAAFYMEKLIEINGFKNASVIPIGLSNECKVVTMSLSDQVDAGASVVQGFRDANFYSASKYVSVSRGDDVLETLGIKDISILKIDFEGAETEVIIGLAGTLRSSRPFVLCEILPIVEGFSDSVNHKRLSLARQVESEIRSLEYEIFQITSDCMFVKVDDIHTGVPGSTPDYVFVPAERAHILSSSPKER